MSKIKKSEEVLVEREKEIQQASACTLSMFLVVCSSPMFFSFLINHNLFCSSCSVSLSRL